MKKKSLFILLLVLVAFAHISNKIYKYYSPATERLIYMTSHNHDDTLRIAYIGDSWALGHADHHCEISHLIENILNRPVTVASYGIGGLTSKEFYNALFEITDLKLFLEKGYDYCYISVGINDTHKKMSTLYYKKSINCIIQFMITNNIYPIIQEIPDYNIIKIFDESETIKTIKIRLSMIANNIQLDCKQQFRNALDELIIDNGYQNKVCIIRYKSWNSNYETDLKELYNCDQLHLSKRGYSVLDSVIADAILNIELSKNPQTFGKENCLEISH